MIKKGLIFFFVFVLVCTVGKNLLPLQNTFFETHDASQAARIEDFTLNIKSLHIPPRIAPHWSYGLGYPVFNFYAPFAYWITSTIHIAGFDIVDSLKLSFLLSIVIGFLGMFYFLRSRFNTFASILGAAFYVCSPWYAVEIFVRGNLAEVWFMAILPWVFYAILAEKKYKKTSFLAQCLLLSFLFSVHNIFSLLSIVLIPFVILVSKDKKNNILSYVVGILMSAYFIIPALLEMNYTYAASVAKLTHYSDHFLCIFQLWTTPYWGYGGSAPGCYADGFSFMLGKMQILAAVIGLTILVVNVLRKKRDGVSYLIALIGISSLFLTLYVSQPLWKIFAPIFSLFQFPWRFLVFGLFSLAYLSAYGASFIRNKYFSVVIVLMSIFIMIFSTKYFFHPAISKSAYEAKYLSESYIFGDVAYTVPEYLPKTVDYTSWKLLQSKHIKPRSSAKDPYIRIGQFNGKDTVLDIHYFPYWNITIDGKRTQAASLDFLGRPTFHLNATHTVMAQYQQSALEQYANILSVLGIILAILIIVRMVK